ncbi:MAG: YebC/PmpR family DNA-binding transcriptional regulator [Ndongobacter sp.]|nr:YebC/PmpR family DNA-binding transcriptional regulator [Ndongobacter sp.]
MSGHNKWSKVKNVKGKEDAKKAKIFTKMARMIMVAVKEGGPDPSYNPSLKMAIDKAKADNMPNDNIERAIKKGSGESDGAEYVESTYEGYGPEGVAVIVECLTDNKNRTAANVRHAFDKHGGNLGTSGSVTFLFDYKGILVIDGDGLDEEAVMMDALDAGAEDFREEDGEFVVTTAPSEFSGVKDALTSAGYSFEAAQIGYLPKTTSAISSPENIVNMEKMIDQLEDDDDVQEVYTNWARPEEEE